MAALQGSGLAMVVALQYFDAADWQKALLAAAPTAGMLFGPAIVLLVARLGLPISRAIGLLTGVGVLGLLVATAAPGLGLFMTGLMITGLALATTLPLVTALWRQNAPAHLRGRLFSSNLMLGACASLCASLAIAGWIGDDPSRFRPVLVVLALALSVGGAAAWRIPTQPLAKPTTRNPIAALALLWRYPLFGYMSFAWYLIGIANLGLIPLRVEYAGSAERGLGLAAGLVLVLTVVVPECSRLLSIPLWGRLFDRMNFIVLRITINVFFVFSVALFFVPNIWVMALGSVCFGLAAGGGNIAWSLWVTKFSPPDRTADFMAVHIFLTGTRGILGPQLAYVALNASSMGLVAAVGTGVLIGATLLFVPVIGHGRRTASGERASG